jgi:hypothetical protein
VFQKNIVSEREKMYFLSKKHKNFKTANSPPRPENKVFILPKLTVEGRKASLGIVQWPQPH